MLYFHPFRPLPKHRPPEFQTSGGRWIGLVMLMGVIALGGCEVETRVVRQSFPMFRKNADHKPKENTREQTYDPTDGQGWSIPLASFTGPGRVPQGQQLIQQLRSQGALPSLWLEDVNGEITVHCGRFSSANDPEALLALEHVRSISLEGEPAFVEARLHPLVGGHHVMLDPLNIKQYAGFFTLQVAVFTKDFPGDRKAAAEKLAQQLREQKEEAYFYHGPHNSSVCIGLFTWDDFVREGHRDVYGPRIKALQKRYPYNTVDHKKTDPDHDPPQSIQYSSLVRVI